MRFLKIFWFILQKVESSENRIGVWNIKSTDIDYKVSPISLDDLQSELTNIAHRVFRQNLSPFKATLCELNFRILVSFNPTQTRSENDF